MSGAKEGDAFLHEFTDAGFKEARILKTYRNQRTKNKKVVGANIIATK